MMKRTFMLLLATCTTTVAAFAAEPATTAQPTISKICTTCHAAEPNVLRGTFDAVAFKSKTIQLKIDNTVQLVTFDEDEIKSLNREGKKGDGELLKAHKMDGHEVAIHYAEKNGVKFADSITEKPVVKLPPEMLISTEEVAKLVAAGPQKGKYFLFDSRPLQGFQTGSIPFAVNLPFPDFDQQSKLLPADKNAQIIFFCCSNVCYMSSAAADKAKNLGYSNIKVYRDGVEGWLEKKSGNLSVTALKTAWIDKEIPLLLLDARSAKAASKGFIKGAVTFPAPKAPKLAKSLDLKKNTPIVVYDQNGSKDSETVANALIKEGYKKVLRLEGGFDGWKSAKNPVAKGKLSAKATYTPKPKQGEIALDEFKKYAETIPGDVVILDVRNADEHKKGAFKSSVSIPAEELHLRAKELPKDKLVITHCATGVRAEMAYHELKSLGFTNVKFLNFAIEFEKDGSYSFSKE